MSSAPFRPEKIWKPPHEGAPSDLLRASLNLPDLAIQLLLRQGIQTSNQAKAFLNHSLYQPASPYDFSDMEKSIHRLCRAVKLGEKIGVWGDFDVDGQTATATLVSALRSVGATPSYHVPIRKHESHGIKLAAMQEFLKHGCTLLLTCDTGISEYESIAAAQHAGVDVILTDHHTLPERLPPAYAIINPHLLEEGHPLSPLPGVGVVYKLAEVLLNEFAMGEKAQELHDLCALGIVADVATLVADARYLVQSGLERIRRNPRPSLKAMLTAAEVDTQFFSEESIGFALAPRLNAVGRLADANPVVEFLISEDPALISVMVNQLEGLNAQRKLLCDQVMQGALEQIKRDPSLLDWPALILSHSEWPAGVVGIVASRLVELYHRPVLLMVASSEGELRGSARSIEGIDITAAIRSQAQLLLSFGGHPMAAGLALESRNFELFRNGLQQNVERHWQEHPPSLELQIDAWQNPADFDLSLLETLDRLAPFGAGNPAPVFAANKMRLVSTLALGKTGEHTRVNVEDEKGNQMQFLRWQSSGLPLPEGLFDLAYSARASTYKGQRQVQLEWIDFKPSSETSHRNLSTSTRLIEHNDMRAAKWTVHALQPWIDENHPQIYCEGTLPNSPGAHPRSNLVPSSSLLLWTVPPTQQMLTTILQRVNPTKILWYHALPYENEIEILLKSIGKTIKSTLVSTCAVLNIIEIAESMSITESLAKIVLRWFAARGNVTLLGENEGIFEIAPGGQDDAVLEAQVQKSLQNEFLEMQAFRRFYLNSTLNTLFEPDSQ